MIFFVAAVFRRMSMPVLYALEPMLPAQETQVFPSSCIVAQAFEPYPIQPCYIAHFGDKGKDSTTATFLMQIFVPL